MNIDNLNQDIYVWAGFSSPGKHQLAIQGSDEEYYSRCFAVQVREANPSAVEYQMMEAERKKNASRLRRA